jgi:hypothetical protein
MDDMAIYVVLEEWYTDAYNADTSVVQAFIDEERAQEFVVEHERPGGYQPEYRYVETRLLLGRSWK